MSDGNDSASHGPATPAEALQQGSMNAGSPFFTIDRDGTAVVPEAEKTEFGTGVDGRSTIVLPGKYPVPAKVVRTVGERVVTVKKGTLTRVDH